MNILIHLLMAVEAIVCLMLIGIILIQKSKGQGLGVSFGGGAAESVFGGQMGNVLTRTTVILAVAFLANTTLLAVLKPRGQSADVADRFQAEAPAAEAPAAAPTDVDLDAALDPTTAEPVDLDAALAPAVEAAPAAPAAEAPAAPAVEAPAAPAAEAPAAPAVEAPAAPAVEAPAAPAAETAPAAPAEAPAAPAETPAAE